MKYAPVPPPTDEKRLAQWAYGELQRIAATLTQPEATTVQYGKEWRNVVAKDDTTYTLNWRNGQKQGLLLSNSATAVLTFAPPEGVCNLMLKVTHVGAARKFTLPDAVHWQGGTEPTWSVSASAIDVMAMYFDGTYYHATASVNSQ
jgi:hypothetical protein